MKECKEISTHECECASVDNLSSNRNQTRRNGDPCQREEIPPATLRVCNNFEVANAPGDLIFTKKHLEEIANRYTVTATQERYCRHTLRRCNHTAGERSWNLLDDHRAARAAKRTPRRREATMLPSCGRNVFNAMRPSTALMIRAIDGGQLKPPATLVQLQRTDGVE